MSLSVHVAFEMSAPILRWFCLVHAAFISEPEMLFDGSILSTAMVIMLSTTVVSMSRWFSVRYSLLFGKFLSVS